MHDVYQLLLRSITMERRRHTAQSLRTPPMRRAPGARFRFGTRRAISSFIDQHMMLASKTRNWLLYAAILAMPAVLLYSSIRTFRELDAQREVYLRARAASVAGLLEASAEQNESIASAIAAVSEGEPELIALDVEPRPASGTNAALDAVWSGRELFHTEFVQTDAARVYRAYVPFHSSGAMNVAKIDLNVAASDFLVMHARHNVIISSVGGVALIVISLYSLWAARRTAALERKQLELQHLAQLGTMSAVLAHEIRNPLGTIKGFAQLAMEQAGSSVRPLLEPVLDQAKRLELLVNDLLIYGRPPTPNVHPVEWAAIADSVEATARRGLGNRAIRLMVEKPPLTFETDPNLMEHILGNLVRNAIDAVDNRPQAEVRVAAAIEGGNVVLSVEDNGPGIPDSEVAKVQEPFFTTKAFGTGLGLPITARLAKALNGTFEIGGSGAHGTTAVVRFPVKG